MNLHITHDDKFIDIFIKKTKEFSDFHKNTFIIYTHGQKILKYVKSPEVKTYDINSDEFKQELWNDEKYKKIFIHYFADELVPFVEQIPEQTKVYWIFWGADIFNLSKFKTTLLTQKTQKQISVSTSGKKKFKDFLSEKKRMFVTKAAERRKIKSISRINFFAHYLKEDYNLIKKSLKISKFPQFLEFSYADLENFSNKNINLQKARKNIIIGNSANPSNNHIDAFYWLYENLNSKKEYKIVCPLSYSGTEDYKSAVVKIGKSLFNEYYLPLTDFVEKTIYFDILENTDIAIMWQLRSQAWGNIIGLLQNGTKVFMTKKSNLYQYLKSLGLIVFSVEEHASEINNPNHICSEIAKHNIKILQKHYDTKAVKTRYIKLLEDE